MLSTSLADQVSRTLQMSGTTTTPWIKEGKKGKGMKGQRRREKDIVSIHHLLNRSGENRKEAWRFTCEVSLITLIFFTSSS